MALLWYETQISSLKTWDSVTENQSVISKHTSYIHRSQRENASLLIPHPHHGTDKHLLSYTDSYSGGGINQWSSTKVEEHRPGEEDKHTGHLDSVLSKV